MQSPQSPSSYNPSSDLGKIDQEAYAKAIAGPMHDRRPLRRAGEGQETKDFFDFLKDNPLLVGGTLATCAILGTGFRSMIRGDTSMSQRMMRWRVIAQATTIFCAAMVPVWKHYTSSDPDNKL
eukprot:CAMPEP_0177638154 /NCGR_PEP_ID=MMETSP0447-20121125/5340_1 /TAXON_ID=0 /ORGANISM="Stygamoeba regulata, Strain BSH-02190019" /LENGTH=122 /DNA_ID=CAMNT_0019140103 /DNA_START=103 /DNA_END=471 /DNA_ORIENTATION=-